MPFDQLGHMHERDEWLIGRLDQQELQWIAIEGNALERAQYRAKDCATGD